MCTHTMNPWSLSVLRHLPSIVALTTLYYNCLILSHPCLTQVLAGSPWDAVSQLLGTSPGTVLTRHLMSVCRMNGAKSPIRLKWLGPLPNILSTNKGESQDLFYLFVKLHPHVYSSPSSSDPFINDILKTRDCGQLNHSVPTSSSEL